MKRKVVQLVKPRANHETETVLRELADLNQRIGVSVWICYRAADGSEDIAFTGVFKDRPAEAVNVGMMWSVRLAQAQSNLLGA